MPPPHPRIVVLGAGFAGLRAVRVLARAGMDVLWLDGRNYHTFLPLLYQVATAGLEPQAIVYPTRSFLRNFPNVEFRLACIESGDAAARVRVTDDGERIADDHPIVATGGAAADLGGAGGRKHAFHAYDVEDERGLRNHVLDQLERAALRTVPTAARAHHRDRRRRPDWSKPPARWRSSAATCCRAIPHHPPVRCGSS